jgi:hypothetical protein
MAYTTKVELTESPNATSQPTAEPTDAELAQLKHELAKAQLTLELSTAKATKEALTAPWWRSGRTVTTLTGIIAATIPLTSAVLGWAAGVRDAGLRQQEITSARDTKEFELKLNKQKLEHEGCSMRRG